MRSASDRSPPAPTVSPAPRIGATPPSRETGWLPDCVYTGDKFETGLAFFADDLGRIVRLSRESADLAAARRLSGQAALPGLVNVHSVTWPRVLRGRAGPPDLAAGRLTPPDLYDAARVAFMEMLLAGITCTGEFHLLLHQPDGRPWPDANLAAHEILRAARDTGIRLALFPVAAGRAPAEPAPHRSLTPQVDQFVRHADALREFVTRNHPGDDVWVGVAAHSLGAVPPDYLKVIAAYAHTHRLRLQIPVAATPADNEVCLAEHGRTPVALLAEHGLLDKRFTAVHATHLTDDEVRLLGAARATVCLGPGVGPASAANPPPAARLLAAGAALAFGTGRQTRIGLVEEARRPEHSGVGGPSERFTALTAAGARSLGAPSGGLEVGRPADFFTVNLFDPGLAGAAVDGLLPAILSNLERRAIREVWVGARQRVANGRHPFQGSIVSRFVELQQRLWSA